jgi:hypothetical protein
LRWALRSQYTDLNKHHYGPVTMTSGLAGGKYYRAVYSADSAKILRSCDAKIRLGEKRS